MRYCFKRGDYINKNIILDISKEIRCLSADIYSKFTKIKTKELLIHFILFGLITTIISNITSTCMERKFEVLQYDRQTAERAFEEISEIMHTRFFRMQRLLWNYKNPQYKKEREQLRADYRESIDLWNSNLSKNKYLIKLRFGERLRKQFETQIHDEFRTIHDLLFVKFIRERENLDKSQFVDKLSKIESDIQSISENIEKLELAMLEAIEYGKIGRNKPAP